MVSPPGYDPGYDAINVRMAVAPGGGAVYVWRRMGSETETETWRIQTRARASSGVLSPIQTVSFAHSDMPQIAVDARGNAVIAWDQLLVRPWSIFLFPALRARARSADGVLSSPKDVLSNSTGGQQEPQVAVDPDGNAVFAWVEYDGSHYRIAARARSAAGTLSAVDILSAAGQNANSPRVAIDAGGNAVIVWIQSDGGDWRVQARVRRAT